MLIRRTCQQNQLLKSQRCRVQQHMKEIIPFHPHILRQANNQHLYQQFHSVLYFSNNLIAVFEFFFLSING